MLLPVSFTVFSLLYTVLQVQSAKILFVSPNLSNSMVIYTGRMADVLVRAGHNVTFFIPEISSHNKLNGTKLAKVVRMKNLGESFEKHMMSHAGDLFNPSSPTIFSRRAEMTALREVCEQILIRRKELDWLRYEKFDLAIASNLDFCDLGLIRMLNIPVHIWTTTGPIHDVTAFTVGIPTETSYVPTIWDNFMGPTMKLLDKITNFIRVYTDRLLIHENNHLTTQLFRKYLRPDFPEVSKIASDSALLLVNGNEFLDPVRPLPSKAIRIGGVGLQSPPTLRGQFEEIANKGEKGFIVFSLGTAAPTIVISEEAKKQILGAFAYFPDYHFIVKADRDDMVFQNLSSRNSNVDVVSWMPQTSLLAHSKAKLFITHGGYNSVLEAGLNGVPMLVLPLFFDQHFNAKSVEYREIGRAMRTQNLNLDNLRAELHQLLTNPTYNLNAKRIAKLAREQPNQPDETLIKWVNFVLANGPLPELKPELLNQSFVSYNNLDIFSVFFAIIFVCLLLVKQLISILFSYLTNRIVAAKKLKFC